MENMNLDKERQVYTQIKGGLWSSIKDYPGYWVNKKGEILGKQLNIYKQGRNHKGYPIVSMYYKGKNEYKLKTKSVHRIVAETFIYNDNPKIKNQVNHIDGNKENNTVENLEWCTNQENKKHAIDNGLVAYQKGEKHNSAILNNKQVIDIYTSDESRLYMSEKYNISKHNVSNIRGDKTWTHITKNLTKGNYKNDRLLSEDIIKSIFISNLTNKEISEKYNIDKVIVSNIKNGKSYRNITKNMNKGKVKVKKKSKLTEEDVKHIYLSNKTCKELAREYNMSESGIYFIKSDRNYTKITKELRE
jgi:hypothetical protein